MIRLGLLIAPVAVAAHLLRRRFAVLGGVTAVLVEAVLGLAWLIVLAEALGLVGELRLWSLIAVSWLGAALVTVGVLRAPPRQTHNPDRAGEATGLDAAGTCRPGPIAAALVLWVTAAQWVFATANALGSGMGSFDSLWYHMPIAAAFAQRASVTSVLFPEADPSNAYFPADSELLHGLGIIAFGNDFLSPFVNLGWMALGLLACWCFGRRWGVQWWTLCSGAVLFALPILGTTQPGQALNDTVGLSALAIGLALIVAPDRGWLELSVLALALGVAVGTKWTFLLPAALLGLGELWLERHRAPVRIGATMLGGVLLTGGWWYLRALIHTGNPLGLSQRIGPLHLSGASSPLSNASSHSVSSAIGHSSLWTSRFIPGLNHALGPLWPLLLAAMAGAVLLTLSTGRHDPVLGLLALAAGLAGIAYLFYPATAQDVSQSGSFFTYDLRFFTPALEFGLLLVPPLLATCAPRLLPVAGAVLVAVALSAQLERSLWPTQLTRHVGFLALTAVGGACVVGLVRHRPSLKGASAVLAAVLTAIVMLTAGDLVEHHYRDHRYLSGASGSPLAVIDRWAQSVAHTRIALYGTVEQYPLYGATDSNTVTYLGQPAAHGGYEPIMSCTRWQRTLLSGHDRYVVLTPGPTGQVPRSWTRDDADLVPILHPATQDWVFEILDRPAVGGCP